MDEKFAKWKGVDRTKIKWNPTVDKDKCIGCGMCITTCGRNVFDFDYDHNKVIVARPNNCVVGCSSCASWCIFDAISFPDRQIVKDFIKDNKLLKKAKEDLDFKLVKEKKL